MKVFLVLLTIALASAQRFRQQNRFRQGRNQDFNQDFQIQPIQGNYAAPNQQQNFAAQQQFNSFAPAPAPDANGQDMEPIPGVAGDDYPIFASVPDTPFDCAAQQYPGYYADLDGECQVFHICHDGIKDSFLCPNGTVFNQQYFVCDWWFNFDCSIAEDFYGLNANIGVVDESQGSASQNRPQVANSYNAPQQNGGQRPNQQYQQPAQPAQQSFNQQSFSQQSFNQQQNFQPQTFQAQQPQTFQQQSFAPAPPAQQYQGPANQANGNAPAPPQGQYNAPGGNGNGRQARRRFF